MDITNQKSAPKGHSQPWYLLRVEGLAIFIAALIAYRHLGGNGWVFLGLFLVPDLSALGFLVNKQVGSTAYNLVHLYTMPIILLALALSGGWALGVELAAIWVAHIAIDRVIGYGLKYPSAFKDTHMNRV